VEVVADEIAPSLRWDGASPRAGGPDSSPRFNDKGLDVPEEDFDADIPF